MISLTETQWEPDDLLTEDDFSIAVTDRLSKELKGMPVEAFIYIALSITAMYRWLPGEALSSYVPKEKEEANRRVDSLESYFNFLLEEFTLTRLERVRRRLERIHDEEGDTLKDDPDWRKIDWQTIYAAIISAPLSRSEVLERLDRLSYMVLVLVAVTKWAFTEDILEDLREITAFIGEYSTLFAEECERDQEVRKRAGQRGMLGLQTIN